ncbi:MAG: hypothetical protein JSV10_03800 [Candidatus Zixiibacteriota bacterium]|nr:MAG: hypothetical protein JSV10_03800 [candidate division Zixibacteria bacterium]
MRKQKVKRILANLPRGAWPIEGKPYVGGRVVVVDRRSGTSTRLLASPYKCSLVKRLDIKKRKQ